MLSSPWVKYFVLEAGVAAVFPVLLFYIAIYLMGNLKETKFLNLLGDGQFCLYATTLGVLTISDFVSAAGNTVDTLLAVVVMTLAVAVASVIWGSAATMAFGAEVSGQESRRERVSIASLGVALFTVVVGGIFRQNLGIL